jgi:hypothetical protein
MRCEAAREVYNQLDVSLARLFPSVAPATARVTELLHSYACSGHTPGSRTSQWSCWLEFCAADGHDAIPVTEAKLLGYIGCLTRERECGRLLVYSSSLSQYVSAVRSKHLMLIGTPVPPYPLLPHVLRAYQRWEEKRFPMLEVRLGVSASITQLVWTAGMCPDVVLSTVHDCTAVALAFCLGLRESLVLSLQTTDVELTSHFIRLRLSVLKGRAACRVQQVAYHQTGDFASRLDFFSSGAPFVARIRIGSLWLGNLRAGSRVSLSRRWVALCKSFALRPRGMASSRRVICGSAHILSTFCWSTTRRTACALWMSSR